MVDLSPSHREHVAGRRREGRYDPTFVVGGEGRCCVVWHVEWRDGNDKRRWMIVVGKGRVKTGGGSSTYT